MTDCTHIDGVRAVTRIHEFPPVPLKIGGWDKMDYDASLTLDGVTWVRTHGGFGRDREDWVALLPVVSVNVTKYRNEKWRAYSARHETREDAMREAVNVAIGSVTFRLQEAREKVRLLETAQWHLHRSARQRLEPS